MGRHRKKDASPTDIKVLYIIADYMVDHGYPPSQREIADRMGMCSVASANYHIHRLEQFGYVEIDFGNRALRLIDGWQERVEGK